MFARIHRAKRGVGKGVPVMDAKSHTAIAWSWAWAWSRSWGGQEKSPGRYVSCSNRNVQVSPFWERSGNVPRAFPPDKIG